MLINCVAYANGRKLADIPVADISDFVAQPDTFVWVALYEPDAAELEERIARQGRLDFGERTGLDDAAAAVGDQHARACRNFARQVGNASLAKEDAGRVVEGEVVHRWSLQRAAARR